MPCLRERGLLCLTALLCALPWTAQVRAAEQREMLSEHETVAEFQGLKDRKCMGKTSLCPDRCGHSGQLAEFKIVKYLAYKKPGQYGDPRQDRYMFLVQNNLGKKFVTEEQEGVLKALKVGDLVLFSYRHDYVTRDGSKFPERVVTKLQKISAEEAAKLPEAKAHGKD